MDVRTHLDNKFNTGDPDSEDFEAYINDHMQDLALNLLDFSALPPDADRSDTVKHIEQQATELYRSTENPAAGNMGVCILQHVPPPCRERYEQMNDRGRELSRQSGFMGRDDVERHAARIVAVRSATEAASRAAARVRTSGMNAAAVDPDQAITDEAFQSVTNFARRIQGLPVQDRMSSNESKMRLAAMREEFRQGAARGISPQQAAYAWLSESEVGVDHAHQVPFSYSPQQARLPGSFTPDAYAEFKQHIDFLRGQDPDSKVPAVESCQAFYELVLWARPQARIASVGHGRKHGL